MAKVEPISIEQRQVLKGEYGKNGTGQVFNRAYEIDVAAGDYILMNIPESTYEIRLWATPEVGTAYVVEQSPQAETTEEGDLEFIPWNQTGDDAKDVWSLIPGNWFKLSVSAGRFKGFAVLWRG